jgi:hypothetical protein
VFHTDQNWWGALPEITPVAQVALVVSGVFITDRVNKMPLVLAFSRRLLSSVHLDCICRRPEASL